MWYVIQTITGKEQELVEAVHRMIPKKVYKECFFMKRQLLKRLGGEWLEVTETLFPAYVFLDTEEPDLLFYELKRVPEFSKLLGDNQGMFIPLEESECVFLQKLLGICGEEKEERPFAADGRFLVKITRVWLDNTGAVKRLAGPLEAFRGKILRMNLRKRYAIVETPMRGEIQTAMLGIKLEKDPV